MSGTRIYAKNGNVVVADPATAEHDVVNFLGRDVIVRRGVASPSGSGLLLLDDRMVTSETSHEVVVLAVPRDVTDLVPGDRVIIYLGGDDGSVSANGISAFTKIDGVERGVVPERFIWAKVKDGEVIPRGRVILTERTVRSMRAMVRHTFGPETLLAMPDAMLQHGVRATGEESDQILGPVTALYEEVIRTGPRVTAEDAERGQILCFSPSFMSTRLTRSFGPGDSRQYHLVDADEAYYATDD